MTTEAKTNERAWEFSQAQKAHEVGRLQDMVTHASNQNQQLRWNEETQAQETMRWAEQAMSFKTEAERLTEVQAQSMRQRDVMQQEAHRVFDRARADQSQSEAETIRLKDQLMTVLAAGRVIEEQSIQQSQQRAQFQCNELLGCKDCGSHELAASEAFKIANAKTTIVSHLASHVDQLQQGLDTSQRSHQLSEASYGELFGRAESCYTDLSNTKRAYDQTEQHMQAQLLGTSNQTKLANAEIGRLEAQVQ